jgi:hypothetical protein
MKISQREIVDLIHHWIRPGEVSYDEHDERVNQAAAHIVRREKQYEEEQG